MLDESFEQGLLLSNKIKWCQTVSNRLNLNFQSKHGTIILTGTKCKKIPCYKHGLACRWFIVKKGYVKIFELSRVRENVES